MNKFRARQLDASKPIPIYKAEEIFDSIELNNATNRTVPQMPTGMEKEEETEHHLQEAIIHQRVIPVPEYYDTTSSDYGLKAYDSLYPPNYKPTKQMIHILPFSADQDIPDYDMDAEDEMWISGQMDKGELSTDPLHFEEMMDRLEKSSGLKAVTLQDAKVLLKDDDDLITAVYDYWLNKRLRLQHPLILSVKSEKGVGTAQNDPYIAFRKRTEKMQTRKNRKNDESSYEKMLKLRRDLSRAVTLLEMVKRREKSKRELLHITLEIFEKRYELEDFTGALLNELNMLRVQRPAFAPLTQNQPNCTAMSAPVGTGSVPGTWPKVPPAAHPTKGSRRREDRKREGRHHRNRRRHHAHLSSSSTPTPTPVVPTYSHPPDPYTIASSYPQGQSGYVPSLEEEVASRSHSEAEDENPDGVFTFKRKKYINYHAPREGDWPWVTPSKGGGGDPRFRFSLTSLSHPVRQCVGFARRRVGRGGRVWIDRIGTSVDDVWLKTDFKENSSTADDFLKEIRTEWPHYYPSSPREDPDTDIEIDVESVTVPVTFPPDVTLTTTTAASSDELNLAAAVPSSVIITAEVLEGSEQGSVTDLEVSVPSVLDTLLSTDSGVLIGENLQMDLLSSETPTTTSAGGSGIKVVTSVQSSSCVSDSVNISAVSSSMSVTENCSEKDWPLSSAISNAGNSSSTSQRQQHSIDFATQPSSKFVTLDCTNSLPLAVSGLQLSTSNVTGDALHSSSPLSLSSSSSSSSSSPSSSASHCPVVSLSSHHSSTFSSSTVSYSSLASSKLSTSTALSSSMSLSTWSTSASLSKTLSGASPHLTFEKDSSENSVSAICSSNKSTLVTSVNMQSHQKDSLVDTLSVPSGYVIPNNKNGSSAANNTVYLKRRKTLDTNDTFVDDNGTSLSNGPNSSIEKSRCAKVENCVFNETGFV